MVVVEESSPGRRLLYVGRGKADGVEGDSGFRMVDEKIAEPGVTAGDSGGRMSPGCTPSL